MLCAAGLEASGLAQLYVDDQLVADALKPNPNIEGITDLAAGRVSRQQIILRQRRRIPYPLLRQPILPPAQHLRRIRIYIRPRQSLHQAPASCRSPFSRSRVFDIKVIGY